MCEGQAVLGLRSVRRANPDVSQEEEEDRQKGTPDISIFYMLNY